MKNTWPLLLLLCAGSAFGFNQPPMNLGLTSLLDNEAVPPGLYLVEYAQFTESSRAADKNGNAIAGGARITALANMHQLFYISPLRVLGANLGFDILQPVVAVAAQGSLGTTPLTANGAGLGDLVLGPVLQWPAGSLWGRTIAQRVELDVILPTGKYSPAFAANPGSNLTTVEGYYALMLMPTPSWKTNFRVFYGIHGKNPSTSVTPGQSLHFNYAASRNVFGNFWLGGSGYVLQQTTEDKIAGAFANGSKEFGWGLGPALAYTDPGLILELTVPIEIVSRNRFRTIQTTLELSHRF